MELAAAFYISVYSLAALAGGILAWAENVPSVTMLTAPIAIALLFLNERHRLVRLDGGWVALAGFAAFAFPALEFFRGDEEFRLLSGAHLLTILQWVLLAYHKTAHQYWWICALSCLQVAIAAVLTTSPVFGIFILIYMFWALWTLSLFTLLLARLRFGMTRHHHENRAGNGHLCLARRGLHRRRSRRTSLVWQINRLGGITGCLVCPVNFEEHSNANLEKPI